MMGNSAINLLLGTLLTSLVFSTTEEACQTLQYLEFGSRGVVNCGFNDDVSLIFWYNSTNIQDEMPLISLHDYVKSGPGFVSGEFDIYPNGSLFITNVNMQHDHLFTVVTLQGFTSDITSFVIRVVVTVTPDPPYPTVSGCNNNEYCVQKVGREGALTCSLRRVRPIVQLEWRSVNEDSTSVITFREQRQSVRPTSQDNETFDITLVANFTINHQQTPDTLVTVECRALDYPLVASVDLYLQNPLPSTHLYTYPLSTTPYARQDPTFNVYLLMIALFAISFATLVVIAVFLGIFKGKEEREMKHLQNL